MVTRLIAVPASPTRLPAQLRTAWGAGDAVLPLPVDAPEPRIRALLDGLRPHALVAPDQDPERVTPLPAPHPVPDGTALVVATSGSTGDPKGVVLTHRALAASTTASLQRLGAEQGDRFALALPLHHVAGLQVVLRAWACGDAPRIVADPGDPRQLVAADAEHVSLVPTQLARLVAAYRRGGLPADALQRWRSILVGGAALTPELAAEARQTGARIVASYGMTETCGGCVYDGRPLDGVEVALRDDGRIRLRGAVLFSGYLDADDAPDVPPNAPVDADGWFTTGDLGTFDQERLVVLGRADEVVITGGENVAPTVVADRLLAHPELTDVAVLGVPDARWGQRVVAVAVPRDADDPPSLEELRQHVTSELPPSHAPRQVVVVPRIPRDGLGKASLPGLLELVEDDAAG